MTNKQTTMWSTSNYFVSANCIQGQLFFIYNKFIEKKKTSCSQGELRNTQNKNHNKRMKILASNKAPTINRKMTCVLSCVMYISHLLNWVLSESCMLHTIDKCHILISIWSYTFSIKEYLKSINQ